MSFGFAWRAFTLGVWFVIVSVVQFVALQMVLVALVMPTLFAPSWAAFPVLCASATGFRLVTKVWLSRATGDPAASVGVRWRVRSGDQDSTVPADGGGPSGRPSAAYALVRSALTDVPESGEMVNDGPRPRVIDLAELTPGSSYGGTR